MSPTWSSRVLAVLTLWTVAVTVLAGLALASTSDGASDAPGASDDPSSSATPVDAAAVNDAFAALASARQAAAGHVDAELRAAVRVDPLAATLRSPSSIDRGLEEVPVVVELFDRVDPAAGGQVLDQLDAALDEAEAAVAATAAQTAADTWQSRFLQAQGGVVEALLAWNEASRAVHEVASANWELWEEVVTDAATLDENRWRYRTEEEAAGTWEIEVEDVVDELEAARAALDAATEARDAAAAEVTAADARAAAVFANRPAATTGP